MVDWKTRIRETASAAGHILDDDIVEELDNHARAAFESSRAEGCGSEETERFVTSLIDGWIREAAALRRRPRVPALIESQPDTRSRFAGLANDVRYGMRILLRQPSFSILSTFTMALGIGVMTTLFSVAYGVLMRPLPWPESDRLIRLTETHPGATRTMRLSMTNIAYLPWRDQSTTIEGLAAWSRRNATITGSGEAERLLISTNSASLFDLLKAKPFIGAVFSTDDEVSNPSLSKVVLGYGLWQQRFGGKPDVLGQILQLDGKPYTIVGVMPRDFAFPDRDVRAWVPMYVPPVISSDGKSRSLTIFSAMARLKPGVTPAQAAAEASARAKTAPESGEVGMAVFGTTSPADVQAVPALEALTAEVQPALISLLFAVALLLVTAVANVASLQLARSSARKREMAIRAAIGANPQRLGQQLLVEGVLLGVAGGAAGLLLSAALHLLLPVFLPVDFPRLDSIGFAWAVVAFAVVLTFAIGLMLGVLPALNMRRVALTDALLENGTASAGARRTSLPNARMIIMAGQVAIACTLLIGATLLARSFVAMMRADRGFDVSNILTARVGMPDFSFTRQRRFELVGGLVDSARLLPGATRIGFTTGLPLINSETISGFTMKSVKPPVGAEIQVNTVRSVVTQDYLSAIGMRVGSGRGFTSADTATSPKVVVVNRTFAKRYLTDRALGDHIANFATDDNVEFEVIGVVDDIIKRSVSDPPQPEIYTLNRQMSPGTFDPNLGSIVIRTSGDPRALIEPLKRIVRDQDPGLTLESIATMEDRVATVLSRPRLYASLLGAFALSALVIASVGLFGVLSYTVAQRKREIAIRSALGATPGKVVRLVLGQGLAVTIVGLALGIGLSLLTIGYLSTLLYGVSVHDVMSYIAVPVAIATIASLASLVPAIRAARIDAMSTIRSV